MSDRLDKASQNLASRTRRGFFARLSGFVVAAVAGNGLLAAAAGASTNPYQLSVPDLFELAEEQQDRILLGAGCCYCWHSCLYGCHRCGTRAAKIWDCPCGTDRNITYSCSRQICDCS